MEECQEVVNTYIDKAILTIVFIYILVHLHFMQVVYTHWKNHGRQ